MGLFINGIEYDVFDSLGNLLLMDIMPSIPITNGLKFFSSDNYIFKDIEGTYLTTEYIQSLSSDGSVLQDFENNYLAMKKG